MKVYIDLDEDDLARIVAEHLPGVNPKELTIREAWQLLEYEAEYLLIVEQYIRLAHSSPENIEQMKKIPEDQKSFYRKLRDKYSHV